MTSVPKSKRPRADPIQIAGTTIAAGQRERIELPVSRLATETLLTMPIEVIHGRKPGATIWISAAVHGDELNGVEIIRQVLKKLDPAEMSGTVIAVPIVNVFGFLIQSRYLPDRRDLNRSFPGSQRGSLAGRLANLFMTEVVSHCQYGIDLHTGSNHRTNLPQLRANLNDESTRRCAEAFHAPVMMHSETRDGSLREAAAKRGIHVLLYEAGEPLRFDAGAVKLGVQGVLRVLRDLKIRRLGPKRPKKAPIELESSKWIRARRGGMLRLDISLGTTVKSGEFLGAIADAFGDNELKIKAPRDGVVIGMVNNPLVHAGDGIIHLAGVSAPHMLKDIKKLVADDPAL